MTGVLSNTDLLELEGLQPNGVLHYDFRSPENAAKKLGSSFRIMQWNIERGVKCKSIIDVINSCQPDIIFLQEMDVHCRRSGYLNTVKEVAKGVEAEIFFVCEFIELDSPIRSSFNSVGTLSDTPEDTVPLPLALQQYVEQGGKLKHFHGNAILSRRAHLTDPTVVPHTESVNWDKLGKQIGEPRVGCRNFIRVCIPPEERSRPNLPPVHLYSSHFEVFCGLLTRVRHLGEVMSDIKLVQRSYRMYVQSKDNGSRKRFPQPAFILAGDLNTMAHGFVRFSPMYARDRMRLLSYGETEACWLQRKVLSRRMSHYAAKKTNWLARTYDAIFNHPIVWKWLYGFTESELDTIDNQDTCLYDPSDKVNSVTWCGSYYMEFVHGKYDWILLSNFRPAPFQCSRDGTGCVDLSTLLNLRSIENPVTVEYLKNCTQNTSTFRETPKDGYLIFNENYTDSDHRGLLMTVEQHTGSPVDVYPKTGAVYTSSLLYKTHFFLTRLSFYVPCCLLIGKVIHWNLKRYLS